MSDMILETLEASPAERTGVAARAAAAGELNLPAFSSSDACFLKPLHPQRKLRFSVLTRHDGWILVFTAES